MKQEAKWHIYLAKLGHDFQRECRRLIWNAPMHVTHGWATAKIIIFELIKLSNT